MIRRAIARWTYWAEYSPWWVFYPVTAAVMLCGVYLGLSGLCIAGWFQ